MWINVPVKPQSHISSSALVFPVPGNPASIPHKAETPLKKVVCRHPRPLLSDTGIEETKFGSKRYEELSPDFES